MLDNEPNNHTQAADQAATDQNEAPSGQAATAVAGSETPAPAKKATRKRATKKAAATQVDPAEAPVSTQSNAAAADPAPAEVAETTGPDAAGAPAKKTAAKRTAKKTAAKRPAKKAAARPDSDAVQTTDGLATGGQTTGGEAADGQAAESQAAPQEVATTEAPAAAPVKKATRKRTTKKAAAPEPELVTSDSPVTDGPVAAVDTPDQPQNETPAVTPQPRTRRRGPATAAVLFQAPIEVPSLEVPPQAAATSPVEATPEPVAEPERPSGRRTRRRRAEPQTAASPETAEPQGDEPQAAAQPTAQPTTEPATGDQPSESSPRRSRRSRRGRDPEEVAADRSEAVLAEARHQADAVDGADEETDEDAQAPTAETDDTDDTDGTRRRRRRRGGRRRRKGGDTDEHDDETGDDAEDTEPGSGAAGDNETGADAESEDDQSGESDDETEGSGSTRRRRRRRRRKGEDSASAPDDPDETVVRVREPRSKNTSNEITAVEGSTRLEAKKQRRREGRAAGRRRAPIVTEAEFLARRESVERTMVIRARGDLTQIAVSEDNVLVEHYVAQEEQSSLIGNVYLGRVQNVLPSMEAAFIDIGKGRNAVLYAGEVDWSTLGAGNGPRKIESVLKSGQSVLVQVSKDPIGHKGARLTNQISLPGRYVVYVPRGGNGGISRKLPDTERNRLKGILKDIVPDEAGVIVRTAAEGASEDELTRDVSRLQSYWEDIDKKSRSGQAPQLLYGEPDLLIRVVRDLFTEDFAKLVISGDEAYDLVKEYVSYVAPHLADRVEKWSGQGDVFSNYRIDEQIKKALDRKVWLPSGGSLVIDRTEAMTVVDVNTGKFTGSGGNLEETVTKNNLEAAEEIVRQLRLRDIGGIIVVDFIDMVLELNRDLVLRRLVECLGRDRTKHQVAEVTSLGLVQMTRKRIGTGLLEAFGESCDHCGGRGVVLHDEPKASRRRDGNGDAGGDGAKATRGSQGGRGRGRGRGDAADEQPETPNDAAKRLAEIAAASAMSAGGDRQNAGDASTTGQDSSPEGSGADQPDESQQTASAEVEADHNESGQGESKPNGPRQSGSGGRRRRGNRSGGGNREAGRDEGDDRSDSPELAVTPV
jgi:ribonuclease E